MPGQLCGSRSYIWYTSADDCLGVGATGAVYRCRHKKSGDLHAVKTFNSTSMLRPMEVQMREFDLLKKLNHENIVKLLAIEEEEGTRSKVIIMELCAGGSLYNVLSDPENMYGLGEDEFLAVLRDVSEGVKHLREQSTIHRDIKPGNIMRYINDEGRIIYKLADFGAARKLEDEEQFVSLFGTEEFLHPDMYRKAVMRQSDTSPFQATVDLWSLGVTFYQAATGQLPFRPYGGRRNKDTMYYITSEKPDGVISGVQHSENGDIEWCKQLPHTCRLSMGLQTLLVKLLVRLLDHRKDKTWSFNAFFDEVTSILQKREIYVFVFNTCSYVKVYIDETDNLSKFQELLAEQTDIPAGNQLLVIHESLLSEHVTAVQKVASYPKTTRDDPLYLFTQEFTDLNRIPVPSIPPFPKFRGPSVNLADDSSIAKYICTIIHLIERESKTLDTRLQMLYKSQVALRKACENQLSKLQDHIDAMAKCHTERRRCMHKYKKSHEHSARFLKLLKSQIPETVWNSEVPLLERIYSQAENLVTEYEDKFNKIKEFVSKLENKYAKKLDSDMAELEQNSSSRKIGEIGKLCEKKNEAFRRDKNLRQLDYNQEQIHKLERSKLHNKCTEAKEIFDEYFKDSQEKHMECATWFYNTSDCRKQCRTADAHLAENQEKAQRLTSSLEKNDNEYNDILTSIQDSVNSKQEQAQKRSNKSEMLKDLQLGMKSLSIDTKNFNVLVKENHALLDKFGEVLNGHASDSENDAIAKDWDKVMVDKVT